MFARGIGDEDGAAGETSSGGVEGIVGWERRLKHIPIYIVLK